MADEILRGQVEDFMHRKPDGWSILLLFVSNGQVFKVTGVFPDHVQVGDTIEICGKHIENTFGKQFKASHMLAHLSGRPDTIELWLKTHLPNIGDIRAKALVAAFGSDLWYTIEHNPKALMAIPGVNAARVDELVAAYAKVRNQRDYVLQLTAAGLTIKDAAAIMAELGHEAFTILASDPYSALLRRRIPFDQADKVALGLFKIAPHDARRVRAFAHRVLFDKTYTEGHCYTMLFELVRTTAASLKVKDSVVEEALVDYSAIVVHSKRCMLLEIDEAEQAVAAQVRRLLERVEG